MLLESSTCFLAAGSLVAFTGDLLSLCGLFSPTFGVEDFSFFALTGAVVSLVDPLNGVAYLFLLLYFSVRLNTSMSYSSLRVLAFSFQLSLWSSVSFFHSAPMIFEISGSDVAII